MILKNSLNYLNEFFDYLNTQIRKYYLSSKLYNKKISKVTLNGLEYKPSPSLLESIIKYNKEKVNINNFLFSNIWENKNLNTKNYKNLNSFFWLFTLDLKSSKKDIRSIIQKWIEKNYDYNISSWEIDTLSKRIISWISNSKISYEDSNEEYKNKFDGMIKKQINHLMNEIERSKSVDDKMIGCSAIVLSGIAYNDNNFLSYGLRLLKKIIKLSFDNENFPKSNLFLNYSSENHNSLPCGGHVSLFVEPVFSSTKFETFLNKLKSLGSYRLKYTEVLVLLISNLKATQYRQFFHKQTQVQKFQQSYVTKLLPDRL